MPVSVCGSGWDCWSAVLGQASAARRVRRRNAEVVCADFTHGMSVPVPVSRRAVNGPYASPRLWGQWLGDELPQERASEGFLQIRCTMTIQNA